MNHSSFDKNKLLWKSLNDYNGDLAIEQLKQNEFAEGVTDEFNSESINGISRRKFLALLSASAALTATACSDYRDKGEIIPYNKRPEEIFPGVANQYASTCNGCKQACGILIKTREGRPIKVDGNPDHPINKGKICAKGQASILNLYDPERLKTPAYNRKEISWNKADADIISVLNEVQRDGKEIIIFTESISSPTTKKVLDDFTSKYTNTKIFSYSLINDEQRRQGWFECYGTPEHPAIKFDEAKIILSLDSDFLGNEGNYIENTRKYSSKREVVHKTDFNRLYVAEGRMSATGMMADYRIAISPDYQLDFVLALINELLKTGSSFNLDSVTKSKIEKYNFKKFDKNTRDKITLLLNDLNANRGKSIVHAGDTLQKEVHCAVNLLNEILGNNALYDHSSLSKSFVKQSSKDELDSLIDAMKNGKVGVVIHFDSNPVYTLPGDYDYSNAIKNVSTIISLTESENESSVSGNYSLPINHSFESWGDANTRSNVYSLQQPVISPIFNTRQKEAILLNWLTGKPDSYKEDLYHKYLINNFENTIYSKKNTFADSKTFWNSSLHDGVVLLNEKSKPNKLNLSALNSIQVNSSSDLILHLTESYFIGDGRFANNGWLQETPHPVSKITWDNYAAISPALAKKINVEMNDLVLIEIENRKLELPVLVQPGMNNSTINIEFGYGRTITGEVGKNVGFNSNFLMSKNNSASPYILKNVSIKKSGGVYKLVSTQEHHSLDDTFVKDKHLSRKIIQEGTVEKFKTEPGFLHEEKEKLFGITREHEYTGLKWAMAIDLNKCTSCGVCVASCNVENNVPVVGKDQVELGREMQWIRIDRYYSGTPEEPIVSNQPMLCQHCDNAPCENVCPVNATNHSPDGLNQMAYNRCVGTRYCSNNCPYKVRRYNFFNYRDYFANAYYENNLTALVHNPEVTVRSRGVMEKCTFCVQKIMEARSDAIRDGRTLKGTDVVTACQQACPANAIVFGDANDSKSEISKFRNHKLAYHVLEELNIKPNVTYIAKLRNIDSEEL